MKTWKQGIIGILAIIALTFAFIACDDGKDTHTHEWEWQVTTPAPTLEVDGVETETCKTCGATSGKTQPINVDKNYIITLKDGDLVFTVAYRAKATDAEPAYLTYLQTRLEAITTSTSLNNVVAVEELIKYGGSKHIITVEYIGSSYAGLVWNSTTRTFTIHNDWIATASGVSGVNALTLTMMREAFESVEAE